MCSSLAGSLWPLTGLPKTNGTSALSKRCLNPSLKDGLSGDDGGMYFSSGSWPSALDLHSNQISLFPSLRFGNGFQIYWRWRSLLASSRLIIENWNTEFFCWWFGGYVCLFKGLLPSAAGGTSPTGPAGHQCRTEQGCARSAWKDCVLLPKHLLTLPLPRTPQMQNTLTLRVNEIGESI